ncbi:cytochrome P450 [Ceratobasidium sp. AG-I]|nr:cytochrome P450 [Ceratobasidium sp. AG-I]
MDMYSPLGAPFHDRLQDTYGSLIKLSGILGAERLYISDPRALHEILVKENDQAFRRSQGFLDLENVPTFELIAQDLKMSMTHDLNGSESKDMDMLHWCSAAALEIVGQAGDLVLGHTFGILQGVESTYNYAIKSFVPAASPLLVFQPIMCAVYNMRPASWRRRIIEWIPHAGLQKAREIIDIQDEQVSHWFQQHLRTSLVDSPQAQAVLQERRRILDAHKGGEQPKDIMSILLQANSEATKDDQLPEEQLLGQMNGALARVLHLLSLDQTIQDRLRAELQAAPQTLDYNELHSLEYLDAICREVLRLYPPVPTTERDTLKDWIVPLRYPIKGTDGRMIHKVEIKKGTTVVVSIRGANRCKETWGEDANEFRPERWLESLPSSVMEANTPAIYSSMMTFLGGPRACIGFRFSLLELKVLLSMLVRSFRFTPTNTAVEWRLGLTMTPFEAGTKLEDLQPRLPLRVTML